MHAKNALVMERKWRRRHAHGSERVRIVVAGAGPAGLTSALGSYRSGAETVTVIEKGATRRMNFHGKIGSIVMAKRDQCFVSGASMS